MVFNSFQQSSRYMKVNTQGCGLVNPISGPLVGMFPQHVVDTLQVYA